MPDPASKPVLRIQDLVIQLLSSGFVDSTAAALNAIYQSTNNPASETQILLTALLIEAEQLFLENLPLLPTNQVFLRLLGQLGPVMAGNATLVEAVSQAVVLSAVETAANTAALTSTGLTVPVLGRLGVQWSQPSTDAVLKTLEFLGSDAFLESVSMYGPGVIDTIQNQAVLGALNGWNARTTADRIVQMTEGVPSSRATTMLRTLNNTAYRYAAVANRVANGDILDYQIRLSALKVGRTCMACLALHGTTYPIEEAITDHHNGLCTSICKVSALKAPVVMSGADYFDALKPAEQEKWMSATSSGAAWRAFSNGSVNLQDFVGEREDAVYGPQVIPLALKEILGPDDAQQFYSFNIT